MVNAATVRRDLATRFDGWSLGRPLGAGTIWDDMKVPTYALSMDPITQQTWVVCLKAPFLIFAIEEIPFKDLTFHQPVFPESCVPQEIKDAIAANPRHDKIKHRYLLPKALSDRITRTTSRLHNVCMTGGLRVRPITRPGLMMAYDLGSSKRRMGILDLRDMSAPIYAPLRPIEEGFCFQKTFAQYQSGRWIEEVAHKAPGLSLYAEHARVYLFARAIAQMA